MMLQLNPPVPLDTPKGPADAHLVIDYGSEGHILFVTFVRHSGECWTWQARECQLEKNVTGGVRACAECDNLRLEIDGLKDELRGATEREDAIKRAYQPEPRRRTGFDLGDEVEHADNPGITYKVADVVISGYELREASGDRAKDITFATPDKVLSPVPF
jgi:hypothetical protein